MSPPSPLNIPTELGRHHTDGAKSFLLPDGLLLRLGGFSCHVRSSPPALLKTKHSPLSFAIRICAAAKINYNALLEKAVASPGDITVALSRLLMPTYS